ncbi:hypothetical protein [Roseicitreum antarcticum]|uniref:Sulfotransferase family protein n=1 Tax=Roseicitreum antarcticum TaxID=564137 RepID=A0A1H3CSA9_9RHOB|nr:hypothetical protein [Roseicitreum antarcticum]SDX57051.1 hypothetical protein SAMN04488238_11039 [Roseicitreum antarcticum]
MLIGVRQRLVFVANTKTGSTAIEQALAPHCEIMRGGTPAQKHMQLAQLAQEYGFLFNQPAHPLDSYFKFGVMRDPIQWIQSWFRYRKGNDVESRLPADMTLAQFWARRDWNIQRANGTKYLQSDLFTDAQGRLLADVIIPHHDLNAHFQAICTALKIKAPLYQANVSRLQRIGDDIPESLLAEMREFYAEDYALFNRLPELNAAGMAQLAARRAGAEG